LNHSLSEIFQEIWFFLTPRSAPLRDTGRMFDAAISRSNRLTVAVALQPCFSPRAVKPKRVATHQRIFSWQRFARCEKRNFVEGWRCAMGFTGILPRTNFSRFGRFPRSTENSEEPLKDSFRGVVKGSR